MGRLLSLGIVLLSGCASTGPPIVAPTEGISFDLDKSTLRSRGATPQLLAKLDASAYNYFRLLGPQFSRRTCAEFQDLRWRLPLVVVHGDAHLAQLVVTRDAYGLEDFDQAGFGPAVVDLIRYAASLHLLCSEVAWLCDSDAAVAAFYRAYQSALDAVPPEAPLPLVVQRMRAKTPQGTDAWLAWAGTLMAPFADEAGMRTAWDSFVRLQREVRPDRSEAFYEITRVGRLHMGIGSALEHKVLLRMQGTTPEPYDDLFLEARAVAPPVGNECVWRPPHPLYVLMFMALLGRRMPEVFGYVSIDSTDSNPTSPELWVQSWDPGYRELATADIESQAELIELVEDAARQLAGHFWSMFPERLRGQQRYAQLRAFEMVQARAEKRSREWSDEILAQWKLFRAED